jgi:hypothetical protein
MWTNITDIEDRNYCTFPHPSSKASKRDGHPMYNYHIRKRNITLLTRRHAPTAQNYRTTHQSHKRCVERNLADNIIDDIWTPVGSTAVNG